jgi:maltose O-acetyltransferase
MPGDTLPLTAPEQVPRITKSRGVSFGVVEKRMRALASQKRKSETTWLEDAVTYLRITWLNTVAASPIFPTWARIRLLRLGGVEAGTAGVFPHVRFVSGSNVTLGDEAFVNTGVLFDARAHIDLGPRVAVGPRVQFLTSSHPLGSSSHRAGLGEVEVAPIAVEEGCWIGAGAIILGGVTIGRGCVIGAGAVVVSDCKPDGLYVGVPADRKSDLPETPSSRN